MAIDGDRHGTWLATGCGRTRRGRGSACRVGTLGIPSAPVDLPERRPVRGPGPRNRQVVIESGGQVGSRRGAGCHSPFRWADGESAGSGDRTSVRLKGTRPEAVRHTSSPGVPEEVRHVRTTEIAAETVRRLVGEVRVRGRTGRVVARLQGHRHLVPREPGSSSSRRTSRRPSGVTSSLPCTSEVNFATPGRAGTTG